jgi:hypothetical protein
LQARRLCWAAGRRLRQPLLPLRLRLLRPLQLLRQLVRMQMRTRMLMRMGTF